MSYLAYMLNRFLIVAMTCVLLFTQTACGTMHVAEGGSSFVPLFDGESLAGWEGDPDWFRVEDGAIVAGSADRRIPHNYFLNTTASYHNFELRYEVKITADHGRGNGGVQIRSVRVAGSTEVKGYQVDAGQHYWGRLYDESRRRKILTELPEGFSIERDVRQGDWNRYRVIAEDGRIRIWLNGIMVADYTEEDEQIAKQTGFIALQIHSGPPTEIRYRDIRIRELD